MNALVDCWFRIIAGDDLEEGWGFRFAALVAKKHEIHISCKEPFSVCQEPLHAPYMSPVVSEAASDLVTWTIDEYPDDLHGSLRSGFCVLEPVLWITSQSKTW